MDEKRLPIKWYEWYYDVSNYWRVRTYWKKCQWYYINSPRPERILKPRIKKQTVNFYATVTLFKNDKKKKHFKVWRLVAEAFLWLDISNSTQCVIYKDVDWLNNNINNIYIWTKKDLYNKRVVEGKDRLIRNKDNQRLSTKK